LSNCLDYADYVAIFDQYRINKVTVTFEPRQTTVIQRPFDDTTNPGIGGITPHIVTVLDRDTGTVPYDYQSTIMKRPMKETLCTKRVRWSFKPNRLVPVYRSTTDAYKIDTSNEWLDCTYVNVPHFGIQYVMEASSPEYAYVYEVRTKYSVSFKNRR